MDNREIIVNLWCVIDEYGFIYSLRVKAYVGTGTDGEKLEFLQQRSFVDYLIAEPFAIPKRFHVRIGPGLDSKTIPVAQTSMLEGLDSQTALFEDALKVIERRFPSQSDIKIPQEPLVCVTPLIKNEKGVIEPTENAALMIPPHIKRTQRGKNTEFILKY